MWDTEAEDRNPKSEFRKKFECKKPKCEKGLIRTFFFLFSDFFLISDFEFLILSL